MNVFWWTSVCNAVVYTPRKIEFLCKTACMLYSFPAAAVSNYHNLGSLMQHKFILLILGVRSLEMAPRGYIPPEGFRIESMSLPFLLLDAIYILWLKASPATSKASILSALWPLLPSLHFVSLTLILLIPLNMNFVVTLGSPR